MDFDEPEIEEPMKALYRSLRENDRRRYAAIEAAKLGTGGVEYISRLFGCDPKTIRAGRAELAELPDAAEEWVRQKRGGRKSCLDSVPQLAANFEQVVTEHTAGDPVHEDVKWTNLTQQQIAAGLDEAGTPVSVSVVRKLLRRFNYKRRKPSKVLPLGRHPDSNAQFEKIARLKRKFLRTGQPAISMDTKEKELLGNLARPGTLYSQAPVQVYDHDFGGRSRGIVIPHGIYDLRLNRGHVTLGTSHDTCQFAIDSLLEWWQTQGRSTGRSTSR